MFAPQTQSDWHKHRAAAAAAGIAALGARWTPAWVPNRAVDFIIFKSHYMRYVMDKVPPRNWRDYARMEADAYIDWNLKRIRELGESDQWYYLVASDGAARGWSMGELARLLDRLTEQERQKLKSTHLAFHTDLRAAVERAEALMQL